MAESAIIPDSDPYAEYRRRQWEFGVITDNEAVGMLMQRRYSYRRARAILAAWRRSRRPLPAWFEQRRQGG